MSGPKSTMSGPWRLGTRYNVRTQKYNVRIQRTGDNPCQNALRVNILISLTTLSLHLMTSTISHSSKPLFSPESIWRVRDTMVHDRPEFSTCRQNAIPFVLPLFVIWIPSDVLVFCGVVCSICFLHLSQVKFHVFHFEILLYF